MLHRIERSLKLKQYPEIEINKQDRYVSRLILAQYAGCESELTSISHYLYMSVLIKNRYPELSEILDKIAQNEITHFKILEKIIIKSGGEPLINLNVISDNTIEKRKRIPYKKIITDNIIREQNSIQNYKALLNNINNESIAKIINMITDDERTHIKILEDIYECDF